MQSLQIHVPFVNFDVMNIAFSLKNKLKIASLLFCIASCSVLINVLEERSVSKMHDAFVSIYHDRLVPATDLFFISERLRQRSELWQNISVKGVDSFRLADLNYVKRSNAQIDSVVRKYEATKLVSKEVYFLRQFRMALTAQNNNENSLIDAYQYNYERANTIYKKQSARLASNTMSSISELINVQLEVGEELMINSEVLASGTKIYSTIQIILAIAIGLLVVGIVSASNAVKIRNDSFNLN